MSRTKESPLLRRRPLHEVAASHDEASDEDVEVESDDGSKVILQADDRNQVITQKKTLYPDLGELKQETAKYFIKTDKHGTVAAGQYTKTNIRIEQKTGIDSVTDSKSFPYKGILLVFAVALLVCGLLSMIPDGGKVIHVKTPSKVAQIVNELKKEYVNQPRLSFRIIKKALENVLFLKNGTEPLAPAVLLLMSTKGAKDETASFAEYLAELVTSGNGNYQTIYGDELRTEDPDRAKKKLDKMIMSAPKDNEQIVVLIRDLDIIPSKAVIMLHGYCDHENAPLKKAVFIMTINADADLNGCEMKHFDEAAESHLTRVWQDLSEDMLGALLARITVSVAAIYHKGKPAVCR